MSNLCLDTSVRTIAYDCTRYAEECVKSLRTEIKKLEEERQSKSRQFLHYTKSSRWFLPVEKREEYDDLETARGEVEQYYHLLKPTAEKPMKLTRVYQELDAAYPYDMQVYNTKYCPHSYYDVIHVQLHYTDPRVHRRAEDWRNTCYNQNGDVSESDKSWLWHRSDIEQLDIADFSIEMIWSMDLHQLIYYTVRMKNGVHVLMM